MTAGQVNDVTRAAELISGIESDHVIADRAYDSHEFRELVITNGGYPGHPVSLKPQGATLI